jgi:hypothetical protein
MDQEKLLSPDQISVVPLRFAVQQFIWMSNSHLNVTYFIRSLYHDISEKKK